MIDNSATRKTLEEYVAEGCCLLLGAGVTSGYVGTWDTLLSKLLAERFRSRSAVASASTRTGAGVPVAGVADYAGFFKEESNTEKAEFLLSDIAALPSGYLGGLKEWQEDQFSDRVSLKIRESLEGVMGRNCSVGTTKCPIHGTAAASCPMREDPSVLGGQHAFADMYGAYALLSTTAAGGSLACDFLERYATTMTVVELCARRDIRFVVTYNFDTVVEEMLLDALAGGLVESNLKQIHIWTYGKPEKDFVLREAGEFRVAYHQGWKTEDLSFMAEADAIHFIHVHGVAAAGMLHKRKGSRLIFSDHSYQVYQSAYLNWSNTMLQELFSRHPVVGIGFSGIDANFRFFVANHGKSYMRSLTSDESSATRIVLIKAAQDYQRSIEKGGVADAAVIADYARQCREMSETYYWTYFGIKTHWEERFLDIAETLHALC